MTHTITINRRLRPLRLAFLVSPNDKKLLLEIIRINTCLWGGRYNAIIPIFGKTPTWWGESKLLPPGKEILRGYIDAFEPDYVITADGKVSASLGVREENVLKLSDVLNVGREEHMHYGISAIHLYKDLYEKEYQFVLRHPAKMVIPSSPTSQEALFTAACFGDFPSGSEFEYFRQGYQKTFDATDVEINAATYFDNLTGGIGTPLRVGSLGLNVRRLAWSHGPTLYFMDATSSIDIIDFWNLRALGWQVFPVPMQWSNGLVEAFKRFVELNHRPLRGNPKIFSSTTLLKSRRVSKDNLEQFCRAIRPSNTENMPVVMQMWYPRLWDEWARDKDHVQRCEISAQELDVECIPDDGNIGFKTLSPEFASDSGMTGHPKWANVIRIKDYWPGSESAGVIPPGMSEVDRVLESPGLGEISATSEGIVVRCQYNEWPCRWRLPQGIPLLKAWFSERGLKVDLSGAGRIALAMTRKLGGLTGASILAHADIVRLLNNMAHGEIEFPDEESVASEKRVARARFVSKNHWMGLLKRIHNNRETRVHSHWNALVKRGILRVGLQLKCSQCAQTSWYPLGHIAENLQCERCTEAFSFPASSPPQNAWSYRTQGPFTVENYAQGSHVVALALRFFTIALHGSVTWAPGLEDRANKFEVDFSLWWEKSSFGGSAPALVLGECKTFQPFQQKDVARARMLAQRFPGTVLVFATLNSVLTSKEKKLLSSLARTGRKHLRAGKTHAPVMILTATELTHDMGPPYCWRDAGGQMADFAKRYRGFGGLSELCDATQQLHLGMESYGQWLDRELERRRQRWERLRTQQQAKEA